MAIRRHDDDAPAERPRIDRGTMTLAGECSGRVEVWGGDGRSGMSVAAPFVWRCPSTQAVAPFPHPAHRTGQADLRH